MTESQNRNAGGGEMIMLLRVIRGICGFVAALQIIGLIPVLTWLSQPDAINEKMIAMAIFKIFVLVIFGGLFFGLRKLINRLYEKRYGKQHPALAKKMFAL